MKHLKRGLFLVTEGPDGAGKTSTLKVLKWLGERYKFPLVFTKEPGGTVLGDKLRKIIMDPYLRLDSKTLACMFLAARRDHMRKVIRPALQKHQIIICDRFVLSSMAYQGYYVKARNFHNWFSEKFHRGDDHYTDQNHILQLNKDVLGSGVYPDQTFFFHVSPDTSVERLNGRPEKHDRFDAKASHKAWVEKLNHNYRFGLEAFEPNVTVVNSSFAIPTRAVYIWNKIMLMINPDIDRNDYFIKSDRTYRVWHQYRSYKYQKSLTKGANK